MADVRATRLIRWKVSAADAPIIGKIVSRAVTLFGKVVDPMTLSMDITAVHLNGCPLDLEGLLNAQPFDFSHDISGIRTHIDRTTGKLLNCFVPRYVAH